MRSVFIFVLAVPWVSAQNGRSSAHQDHNGHGWDIRLAVPGEPGSDYPTLGAIPRTSFSCAGKEPGYYADLETNCQVFRVCTVGSTYGFQSFLCPNGTLFNQAVFVCDWWMNVNCQASQQLFNNNNEKFGNLRLGPQLMKDIKKMLTHPMRNPYDKNTMKSNLIVMQDYKPPFGQLFPNGALIAGPERSPNNIYVPAKQIQSSVQNFFNTNDLAFAASTPDPRYIPAAFNTIAQTSQRDAEVFQRQRQNSQFVQNNRNQNAQIQRPSGGFSNSHAAQFTQNSYNANLQSRPTQTYNNENVQYGQRQTTNSHPTTAISTQNAINIQRGQLIQQNSQYTENPRPSRLNSGKQAEFGVSYSKQQYSNQQKQPYTYKEPSLHFSSEISGTSGNEAKQNLVSQIEDIPSTVITKTLTLKRIIQDPKQGIPKSRITVKTWIVKPSKSGKLINSTPYTYDKPTQAPTQKLVDSTPYVYNKPTTLSQRIVTEAEQPYVYNKPTPASQKITTESEQPYYYNKPTIAAKQIAMSPKEVNWVYTTPTTPRPILSRLYLSPTSLPSTQSSRLYLPPTTYNPSSRIYLPPPDNPPILSRQYLAPSSLQQPTGFKSEQLKVAPTTPSPTYVLPNTPSSDNPSFSITRASALSNRNLTFTDILTKEKLDLTVDDIVKDTSSFLNTASPAQFGQFNDINSIDYQEDNYLPPGLRTDSGESLTSQSPVTVSKSSKLIESPSIDLEPPVENNVGNQNSNQISNLPFFKESLAPRNTIERTVSLKISIPEKIASVLFKSPNESDYDRLEILNTGSSNYLVLSNNFKTRKGGPNFIPLGKLISDKESNVSNSQALVFSLLADSINVAKEYNKAQQENPQPTPTQPQFQNVNNEELLKISNKISQLTSSQYSTNNNAIYKSANLVSNSQTTNDGIGYKDSGLVLQNQIQSAQRGRYNSAPSSSQNQGYFLRTQSEIDTSSPINTKQVYSGQLYQLPVPDVTSQIYNRQNTADLVHSSQQNKQENQNKKSNNIQQNNADVEIVRSHSLPLPPAAKLEAPPTSELDHFNSQENFNKFVNSNTGISAQLQDKIVGIIPHPLSDNKLVTYKKDESYYVYTKLDNSLDRNTLTKGNIVQSNIDTQQSGRLIQENSLPNLVAFQLIPSVSYQFEDEKEQQKILNAFQIDEFGRPKQNANIVQVSNQPVLTSSVDYSVDHSPSAKQIERQSNDVNALYVGPSSYSAPQSSVGRLGSRQGNYNSRLELEDNTRSNGYARIMPSRQFSF